MRAFGYSLRVPARLCGRAVPRRKGMLRLTGTISCLLAIFISAGAHWAVLQSFAYTKMLVEFAERDSLGTAVKKAFDERYACSLCPRIRDGFNKEQKTPSTVSEVYQLEFVLDSNHPIFFTPVVFGEVAFDPSRPVDFSNAPPKPPPRVA
jgi:hypothetical protein